MPAQARSLASWWTSALLVTCGRVARRRRPTGRNRAGADAGWAAPSSGPAAAAAGLSGGSVAELLQLPAVDGWDPASPGARVQLDRAFGLHVVLAPERTADEVQSGHHR